jgi:hypothetical protein
MSQFGNGLGVPVQKVGHTALPAMIRYDVMCSGNVVHDVIPGILVIMNELEVHDQVSRQVRVQLGDRLERLLKSLEQHVNGSDGMPPMPGHLQAYLSAIKLFGDLYQVSKPPRPDGDLIEASTVAKMVEAARMEAAAEVRQELNAQRAITSSAEYVKAADVLRRRLAGEED